MKFLFSWNNINNQMEHSIPPPTAEELAFWKIFKKHLTVKVLKKY
jgi:hypothetical protein